MTRLAAVLAAAVLGSGCIITSDNGQGSVNLYWDFVRNAPAQPGGFVIYDQDLIGSGDSACPESGVESVDVTSPAGTRNIPCTFGSVQGATFDGVPSGGQSFRVRGWRLLGGVERVVFDHTVTVGVVSGGTVDAYIDVEPVSADIDVGVTLWATDPSPDLQYLTCNSATNPIFTYDLYDSAPTPTLVDTFANLPCTAGASAAPFPIALDPALGGQLDLDTYSIRIKGYSPTVSPANRVFDSCFDAVNTFAEWDHVGAEIGGAERIIELNTPPACP